MVVGPPRRPHRAGNRSMASAQACLLIGTLLLASRVVAAANGATASPPAPPAYGLLIPVECGYGFRDGKLCPGYPQLACPDSCHNKSMGARVEMLANMLRGIAASSTAETPTTVIIAPPQEWNATGAPPVGLQKPIGDALHELRAKGIKIAHYVMTRLPPPLPCCTCCNSYSNITKMVDAALTQYPDDVIFYDNGPFAGTEELYLPLYQYAASWGGKTRDVLFNSEWTTFEEIYLSNTSATMMAYEGYGSTVEATQSNPSKFDWTKYPRKRFAMCIENVTTGDDAMEVIRKGISLHFGSFFITSQTADYSILPSYWPTVVTFLSALNNGSISPPPPAPAPHPSPHPSPLPPLPPPCRGDCNPVVHFMLNDKSERVASAGGCGIGPATVPVLGTTSLVVKPDKYCFEGSRYDLESQGLYQFFDLGKNVSAQRIVFDDDLDALLSAVAWIGAPGNRDPWQDNDADEKRREQFAMQRKLSIACGTIADLGVAMVRKYAQHTGATARRVHLFTLEQPWNDYDDGHYQMELHRGGEENTWELFDLDFNLKPVNKSSGEPITALHMLNLVRTGLASSQVELRQIANDAIYDVSGFAFDGTQYRGFPESPASFTHSMIFFEEYINGLEGILRWYSRIYGGIDSLGDSNDDATCGVVCSVSDQTFISEIGLRYVADTAFERKYYGNQNPPSPTPTPPVTRKCPQSQPFQYGDSERGQFCCSVKPVSTPPTQGCPAKEKPCCLTPGIKLGCQNMKACLKGKRFSQLLRDGGMPKNLKNEPLVYTVVDGNMPKPVESTGIDAIDCKSLPEQLLIPHGQYCFVNQSFHLNNDGLARFAFWCSLPNPSCTPADGILTMQRIVFDGSNFTALVSAISWLSSRGALDVGMPASALENAALTRKLSVDDVGLVGLAIAILERHHVASRATSMKSTHSTWAHTECGRISQTFLEIRSGDEWVAYDLDNDVQPVVSGRPTSVAGLQNALTAQTQLTGVKPIIGFVPLAADTAQDNTGLMANDGNATFGIHEATVTASKYQLARPWAQEYIRSNITRWYQCLLSSPSVSGEA